MFSLFLYPQIFTLLPKLSEMEIKNNKNFT